MSKLSEIIGSKSALEPIANNLNIEKGKIWTYNPGTQNATFFEGICWITPQAEDGEPDITGVVEIEIWGAAGSGGRMCCCGFGLPGNPPAYVKKTICVGPASEITGAVGLSCGNADTLNFRGVSDFTGIVYNGVTESGCLCAEGGRGGTAYCNAGSSSLFTCFQDEGFSVTEVNAGCGYVCNFSETEDYIAQGFGGDVNIDGRFSRIGIFDCNSCCQCCMIAYPRISDTMFSQQGAELEVRIGENEDTARGGGQHVMPYFNALAGITKSPTMGMSYTPCWQGGGRYCSCYESTGRTAFLGTGVPGLSALPCNSIRDSGMRGGHGAVRIRFLRDE